MKVLNTSKVTVIADDVKIADTFLTRFIGLLNKESLKSGEGLIISRCNSIHMFFMKFSIDAIFVGKDNRVVGLVKTIRPFGMSPFFWKANFVIEVPAGVIESSKTELNDSILLQN